MHFAGVVNTAGKMHRSFGREERALRMTSIKGEFQELARSICRHLLYHGEYKLAVAVIQADGIAANLA